jgi:O-antigen/teichoic acid export membrane protein
MVSAPETTIKNNRDEQFSKKGGFGDIGRILLSMCLLCVLIIFFYSHQLITFLFTEKYAIAGDYLIILAIGYTVLFVQQFCGFLNISLEKETGLSRLSLVTIVSIVIFPFFVHLMILAFNFKGAYLATTIFIICYTLVTLALIKDRKPLNVLLLKIDRLIISFFITSVIIYLLNLTLIPGILCSLVVFTSLIFLMGYIDKGIIFDLIRVIGKKT